MNNHEMHRSSSIEFESKHLLICGPFEPSALVPSFIKVPRGFGGVPVNALAREMTSIFGQVTVLGTSQYINVPWRMRYDNLNLIMVPSSPNVKKRAFTFFHNEIVGLKKEIKNCNPDIIHAQWTYEFSAACLGRNIPMITTAHDNPFVIYNQMRDVYRFIRLILALRNRLKIHAMTFVSPYLLAGWENSLYWRRTSWVIPNIPEFSNTNSLKTSRSASNDSAYVVSVGDDSSRKNIENLLKAWVYVEQERRKVRLKLVGNGLSDDSNLARKAKSLGLEEVDFLGFQNRDQIQVLLENAMFMVHPSREESQPVTLVEAMSLGCPVIAGEKSGGVPWTLGDCGLLVDIENPQDIARAILTYFDSESLRSENVEKGFKQLSSKFDKRKIVEQYLAVYHSILAQKTSS